MASREPALAVARRLADAHHGDLGIQAVLTRAYMDIADLLTTTGKPAEALPWSDKALAIQRRMVEAKLSDSRYSFADGIRRRGVVLQKCGRAAEAVSAFREAVTILEGLDHSKPGNMYDLACSQSLLSGVAPDAGSGLTAADGEAEAVKAVESLRRAVVAGWKGRDHMRADTDLDPVRSRPDFRLLMMDMAMPAEPFARGE